MAKRIVGALLWFGAIWFGFELLWSVTGVPRVAGPIVGTLAAIAVTLDPTGGLWTTGATGSSNAVRAEGSSGQRS